MKQIWKWIIVIPIIVGILIAIWISFKNQTLKFTEAKSKENIFGKLAGKNAEITAFYTYGTSLNVEGKISGIVKDNFEGVKLLITNGENYEKIYNLSYSFKDGNVFFSSGEEMNNSIPLDQLSPGKYYLQVRLKANNSKDYKYYTFSDSSGNKAIEYYTLTKNEKNNKIVVKFEKENFEDKQYSYLGLTVSEANLPDNVFDIAIDAGSGGTDAGETSGGLKESNLMLEYAKTLKEKLESKGYKVKLTRDENNSDSFTDTNMYNEDGRITIACKSNAKYMISLHTGESGFSGIQVYCPNNVDFTMAKSFASNLYNMSSLEFSGNNTWKITDGVYQRNFTNDEIKARTSNSEKQGIEPYTITTNTPFLYTIRETGGIATHAFVDGRNTNFGTNKYYNSNQGIETYQISVGSIKKDKEILENEKEQICQAIADVF